MPETAPRPDVPDEWVTLAVAAVSEIEDDGAYAVTAEREIRVALAAVVPVIERQVRERVAAEYQDLLGSIWLYVKWQYVTRQLTTQQKELWADAIEATADPEVELTVDRWWRE